MPQEALALAPLSGRLQDDDVAKKNLLSGTGKGGSFMGEGSTIVGEWWR